MVNLLDREMPIFHKRIFSFICSILFHILVLVLYESTFKNVTEFEKIILIIMFQIIYGIGVYSLSLLGNKDKYIDFLVIAVLMAAALFIRIACMNYESGDYVVFLAHWVKYFKENNGVFALKDNIGDYNVPYLYFLSLISYSKIPDLYLIKIFSIIFDFIIAFYCLKLFKIFVNNRMKELILFFVILFWPTIWLNSALWGQCDSIYVGLGIMGLYYGFKSKSKLCIIFMTISLSFKLQIIFILPVLGLFYLKEKINLKDLIFVPITYIVTLIPSFLVGKPILDTLLIYFKQTTTYQGSLNLNSPSAFALIYHYADYETFKSAGILIAFFFIMVILYVCFKHRENLNNHLILLYSLFFAIGIPWLLPSMHERYFYFADILVLVVSVVFSKLYFLPFIVLYASYAGYHAFLFNEFIIDLRYASLAMLVVLLILAKNIREQTKTI